MAASTRFHAVIRGQGGHGGMPHLARDPVIAAAAIVHALQPLVSRETDPVDGAVISVTRLSSGGRQTSPSLLSARLIVTITKFLAVRTEVSTSS